MGGRPADADLLGGLGAVAHLGVIANLSDAQLLDHFLAREGEVGEAAFEALVARHGAMVFDVCRNVLRDPHDAQDAFQATFLVLAARAVSIRQRETIAGWLLGVARRVSLRSRGDLARQRAREARAAEIRADRPADRPESWQELHEEIGRLPARFREPVVLCYLEGLSADAAALRLGCPRGTVLSRLSRARERLRGRLMRRGFAPALGLLEAGRLPAALPRGLISTTVRASLSFADHATVAAGLATGPAVALARGVIHTMTISRLKVIFAAVMIGALVPGGLWAFGGIPGGRRAEKPDAAAGAVSAPGGPEAVRPGVGQIDRIDFDRLYAGAIAEARPGFEFVGNVDPGLALKIDVPRFAVVKDVRCLRREERNGGGVRCIVTIGLDTRSVGKLAGELKVRLGDREARVPVSATVKPAEAGRPKVLLISNGFGAMGDSADYYRPWFDLARDAGLDVSYMNTESVPLPTAADGPPEELSRYDVILLDGGGVTGLSQSGAYWMGQLVQSGHRVIVMASPGIESGPLHANRILEPMGMRMEESDIDTGTWPGFEADRVGSDRLLEGVRKLSCIRPAMIELRDREKAKILAYLPRGQAGIVAVARAGKGELVAIGTVDLAAWIGERGRGTDNARFLRNLLTMKVGR